MSRSEEEVDNIVSFLTGFASFALIPLWAISLPARPLRKPYATLSVWVDEPALAAFAGGEPHRAVMAELVPDMGPSVL